MIVMPVWHESYRAAALETNWRRLPERIAKAESDMHNRLRSLPSFCVDEALQIAQGLSGLAGLAEDMLLWQGAQALGGVKAVPRLRLLDWQESQCNA